MSQSHERALTYAGYLKVDELLSLQQSRSAGPEHDELLFIVTRQVYELWFKELLHEFDGVRRLLEAGDPHRAQHTLKRILTILKAMACLMPYSSGMSRCPSSRAGARALAAPAPFSQRHPALPPAQSALPCGCCNPTRCRTSL